MDCPMSKQKPLDKRKPKSELAVSHMVAQKLEPKEAQIKEPRAEEPLAEKPLIVSSSLLPGDFFAEEALVALCTLGNNGEIKTTALLDTGATGYSFVDPVMAHCVCNDPEIELIQLSKPKAIRGFDGKRTPM